MQTSPAMPISNRIPEKTVPRIENSFLEFGSQIPPIPSPSGTIDAKSAPIMKQTGSSSSGPGTGPWDAFCCASSASETQLQNEKKKTKRKCP